MINLTTTFDSKLLQLMGARKTIKKVEKISQKPAITVTCIPKEILRHILNVQGRIKLEKCVGQYSQSLTIIKIIGEHKDLTEK